ncbi:integration host factor MihF [Nanchangia anserum]|uniref:Integration host factor MihF n=1 Tax=Nanchangia anserum TaxID=2692125 RepID=A0A8I0G6P4_9ACTO|nr:integration host factor, actinobacterial type [Nanchangia anserum]MBD3688787.1 integration host factor MihF [Nanchangia anserum]QOX82521.1 integration host factor MihF [Nanchangia anserum]
MDVPSLTPQQRAAALEKAAQARRERADVKARLKRRELTLAQVIEMAESQPAIAKMPVFSLLKALPRVGTTTAREIMDEIGISEARRIRGLGEHQRAELLRRFSH